MAAEPETLDDDTSPDEDLVAYLDGELDAVDVGAVETQLASDEATRSKAEIYRKTFELLDYLPKPEPSATFASRTLTKLDAVPTKPHASAANWSASRNGRHSRRWFTLVAWCLAAAVAGGIGYFGHLLAKPHLEARAAPTSQQVRLLERLPLTIGVDDLAFLRKLQASEFFADPEGEAEPMQAPMPAESVSSTELSKLEEIFRKLPAARQQQLRQFDEDFFALDAATQAKLNQVLERYAVWLHRLPENYRQEVLTAPASAERLEAVRRIRVRQWRESLPAAVKARIAETADAEEASRIRVEYKRHEAERHSDWQTIRQEWSNHKNDGKPFPFDNPALVKQVEEYVATVLKPRLNPGELARLEDYRKETATGGFLAWKLYGNAILQADTVHPSLPQSKSGKPIVRVEDVPQEFLRRLRSQGASPKPVRGKRDFKEMPQHGKWPEFAELLAAEAAYRGITVPVPLGPSRPGEFTPEVETALSTLLPKLSPRDRGELDKLQGKWPAYPKLFLDFARKHDLTVPGVSLPGPPLQWAKTYLNRGKR